MKKRIKIIITHVLQVEAKKRVYIQKFYENLKENVEKTYGNVKVLPN